jgi:hypothetical protein
VIRGLFIIAVGVFSLIVTWTITKRGPSPFYDTPAFRVGGAVCGVIGVALGTYVLLSA